MLLPIFGKKNEKNSFFKKKCEKMIVIGKMLNVIMKLWNYVIMKFIDNVFSRVAEYESEVNFSTL